jgi:hypothetical protein
MCRASARREGWVFSCRDSRRKGEVVGGEGEGGERDACELSGQYCVGAGRRLLEGDVGERRPGEARKLQVEEGTKRPRWCRSNPSSPCSPSSFPSLAAPYLVTITSSVLSSSSRRLYHRSLARSTVPPPHTRNLPRMSHHPPFKQVRTCLAPRTYHS